MHYLPAKEIIVNDDSQVIAREDDGTAYADNDIAAGSNTGGLILDGFLNDIIWSTATAAAANANKGAKNSYFKLLASATRMIRTTPSNGVPETAAWAITAAGGAKKGDTYRIVFDSLDLTPTEYQNRPVEKRYQLGVDCANAAAIVAALVAQINGDPDSLCIAYAGFNNVTPAQDDSAKIVLVGRNVGVSVNLYVGEYSVWDQTAYSVTLAKSAAAATVYHTAEDTSVTTAIATLPVNTYAALKNVNWAKNFHIDRDVNWMPLPGATYNSYYFEVVTQVAQTQPGNDPNVGEVKGVQEFPVRVYAKVGTTLATALDLVTTDLNV